MPFTNPSYFPPNRANDTVVGINSGFTTTGARNFFAGKGVGNYVAVSDIIAIGDEVMSAGTAEVPVTDNNIEYSIIIGSNAGKTFASGTSEVNGPFILIGGNSYPSTSGTQANNISIGSNIFAALQGQSGTANNVMIGHSILWQFNEQQIGLEFFHNVVIGNGCLLNPSRGSTWIGNTLLGAYAGENLANFIPGYPYPSGSTDYNTFIGYSAGSNFAGESADFNTCVGAQAGSANYQSNQNVVLIGYNAGTSHDAYAHNAVAAIEANGAGCLFARMDLGNVLLGTDPGTHDFSFPTSATQILKLRTGTVGTIAPTGGGYFYVTDANNDIHWVNSGNIDVNLSQSAYGAVAYTYNVPVTGFALTIANGIQALILAPAATLASGTVTMPPNPIDGQTLTVSTTQAITALTFSPNAGQTMVDPPTTLGVGGSVRFLFNATNTSWYRIGN